MSRSKAHGTQKKKARQADKARRRLRVKTLAVVAAITAVILAGAGLSMAIGQSPRQLHDLTPIGQGTPAVVQVHDTTCPVCVQLRSNISRIEGDFDERTLLIRIADIHTDDGLAFASRYTQHRRVTLLYFNPEGELTDVQAGLQEPAALRDNFTRHANRD